MTTLSVLVGTALPLQLPWFCQSLSIRPVQVNALVRGQFTTAPLVVLVCADPLAGLVLLRLIVSTRPSAGLASSTAR